VAASKASQAETRLQQSQTDCESLREELQTAKAALAQLEKQRLAQSRASFSENDDRLKNLTTECESLREQVRRADQRHLETRQWLDEIATECHCAPRSTPRRVTERAWTHLRGSWPMRIRPSMQRTFNSSRNRPVRHDRRISRRDCGRASSVLMLRR
jgi:hypothetical protein